MDLFQFVYVSSAVHLFTDRDLKELLGASRERNQACDLTGLLLYVNGNFIQLLEGPREHVLATVSRIKADPRHRGLITLLDATAKQRDFPDWSMGFESVNATDAATVPGLSDFLRRDPDPSVRSSGALRLLEFFRDLNLDKRPSHLPDRGND